MSGEAVATDAGPPEPPDELVARLIAALAAYRRARDAERQQRPRLYVVK